jgi:MFS family permease
VPDPLVRSIGRMAGPPLPTELRRAWLAVLAAFAAAGGATGSWGSRIPAVRQDLDLSEGALGTALLGASLGAVSGAWIGGLAERRVGCRAVMRAAWPALGAAVALPALAPSWRVLTLSLLLFGLALGMLDVSMNGGGVIVESRADRPVLSGLHGGWSGGLLVGAASGAAAVAAGLDPDVHLIGVGALIAVGAAVAWRSLPAGAIPQEDPVPGDEPSQGGSSRRMVALAAIGGCVFLAEGAAIDWSGVLVDDEFGGTKLLGSLAVTGVSAGGLLGRAMGDRLVARFGAVRVVRTGSVVATVGLLSTLLVALPGPAPLLLVLLGLGLASAVPLAFGAAGRLRGGRGIAIVTTAGYGAYLTGPAVIGWIAELTSLRFALGVPLVLVAVVGLLASHVGAAVPDRAVAPPVGAVD